MCTIYIRIKSVCRINIHIYVYMYVYHIRKKRAIGRAREKQRAGESIVTEKVKERKSVCECVKRQREKDSKSWEVV